MTVSLDLFIRDQRGVTALEFALLSPVLVLMICGTLEMGHALFARAALEGATVEASRIATATLETGEGDRAKAVQSSIRETMSNFPLAAGENISIVTKVYKDFSSVTPENFTDANGNGRYDFGEAYIDRNANGKWDPAIQIPGTLGGPGDVVSYTVIFPKRPLFAFLGETFGFGTAIQLEATTVVRNESVVRRTL